MNSNIYNHQRRRCHRRFSVLVFHTKIILLQTYELQIDITDNVKSD
jgi:hypothetical protein